MLRRGLIGGAGSRVTRGMAARRQPEPEVIKRDLPPIESKAQAAARMWAVANGLNPDLEAQAMASPAPLAPVRTGLIGGAGKALAAGRRAAASPQGGRINAGGNGFMRAAQESLVPQMSPVAPEPMAPTIRQAATAMAPQAAQPPAAATVAARPAGAFALGPKPASYAAENNLANAQPNFIESMVGYDPNRSDLSGWEYFWKTPEGREASKDRVQTATAQAQRSAALAQQAQEAGLDPSALLAMQLNPEKFGEYLGSNYQAANVGAGESRVFGNGRDTFTAPKFGFEGATPYAQTFGDGKLTTTFGENRPKSYAEITDEGTLAETGRHNRATEANANDRLAFDRSRPAASATGLTSWQEYQMGRDIDKDRREQRSNEASARTSLTNLQETQNRVESLLASDSFDGIYGAFGALGANMGAKPTNVMSQGELDAMALLDQIGGEAFLAGVEKMRGTGPLSDNEGKRVMQAVMRLTNRMQSPEAARQAAQEYIASLKALQEAVRMESGLQAPPGQQAPVDIDALLDDVTSAIPGGYEAWRQREGLVPPQQSASIQPGTVDVDEDTGQRYRFKGGDPTDQRNWEPVR